MNAMLPTLRGQGFDINFYIKMEHSPPHQVCTIVCIICDAHSGQVD